MPCRANKFCNICLKFFGKNVINSYYIIQNGEQVGPLSFEELTKQSLTPDSQVSSSAGSDWQTAADLPELTNYFYNKGFYIVGEDSMAGFWWRFLAFLFDYFILTYPTLLVFDALKGAGWYDGLAIDIFHSPLNSSGLFINGIISMTVTIIYNTIFELTSMRGSLGKFFCRLAVVNAIGQKETFAQALLRNAGKLASSLFFNIGYLSIFWSPYQQTWHDNWAKTYVIRKPVIPR